jgi:hypothetical protein
MNIINILPFGSSNCDHGSLLKIHIDNTDILAGGNLENVFAEFITETVYEKICLLYSMTRRCYTVAIVVGCLPSCAQGESFDILFG